MTLRYFFPMIHCILSIVYYPWESLLGIPLGLGVSRNVRIGLAALRGLGLLGLFYTARALALLSATASAGGAAAPWAVMAAFAGFGIWRFQRMGR